MKRSFGRSLRLLTAEALHDALRRRTILVVVVVCVVAVMGFDSCTSFWEGQALVNGREVDLKAFGRYAGLPMLTILSLGIIVLAGILASDELARPLEDGTANLWLARPVSREGYALSRLLGALLVTLAVEIVLLGSAAALLHLRQDLSLLPAATASVACAASAATAAALAMCASLWLPRVATLLLGAVVLFFVTWGNVFGLFGAELTGGFWVADRLGPPFVSSLALALAPWMPTAPLQGDAASVALRLLAWTAGSVVLLLASFRRMDLPR